MAANTPNLVLCQSLPPPRLQRGAAQYTEKLYEDSVPQDLDGAIVLDICQVRSIISSGVPHYTVSVRAGEGSCTVVD